MRGTSFLISDDAYKRLNLAAAAIGISASEYIRAAIDAALTTHAQYDPLIATAFRMYDEQEKAVAEQLASRELVPA